MNMNGRTARLIRQTARKYASKSPKPEQLTDYFKAVFTDILAKRIGRRYKAIWYSTIRPHRHLLREMMQKEAA